jgi:hypothetical protein
MGRAFVCGRCALAFFWQVFQDMQQALPMHKQLALQGVDLILLADHDRVQIIQQVLLKGEL